MIHFTNPLSQEKEPPIYRADDAHDHLTEGGRDIYIAPSYGKPAREFIVALDELVDDLRMLVGTWHDHLWILVATEDQEAAKEAEEKAGCSLGDVGPVAVLDKDEEETETFPIQSDHTYVVSNQENPPRSSNEDGNREDNPHNG